SGSHPGHQVEPLDHLLPQNQWTDQDDWCTELPIAEFTYNNFSHSTAGVSSFFANKEYHSQLTVSLHNIPSHIAHKVAHDFQSLQKYLQTKIATANKAYSKHADSKR
ncbi:hypothetical protein C0995_004377, partial [Termitomyces sp. Mi166